MGEEINFTARRRRRARLVFGKLKYYYAGATGMNGKEPLPAETKRAVYEFVLALYEAFEALPERGMLVTDIEGAANKILGEVARFSVADERDILVKDIVGNMKALKALLGIVRDMSFLERQKAVSLLNDCTELEEIFTKLYVRRQAEREAETPRTPPHGIDSSGKNLKMSFIPEAELQDIQADEGMNLSASELIARPAIEAMEEMVPRLNATDVLKEKFGNTSVASFEEHPSDLHSEEPEQEEPAPGEDPVNEQVKQKSDFADIESEPPISLRQKAIMEVLKRRDQVSVADLGLLFSGRVSKKTLQRDLQDLIERNIVRRHGDKRWASYSL